MNNLLIVESPAKAKTIGKYLGGDFTVKSSIGHIRDLPRQSGAVKIEADGEDWKFIPQYEISDDKKKIVEDLKKSAKAADAIYLASDPDREGEAIAWHLHEVLAKAGKGKPFYRITYNEITKNAVSAAVANPRDIDYAQVDAQQARRILDRIVGYKVSPMLWKYLKYGNTLSAGRVQSVALRLLVERQREIDAFVPTVFWVMGVEAKCRDGSKFTARLARIDGEKPVVNKQEQALLILDDLDRCELRVKDIKIQPRTRHALPPFTTSTLQQAASSVCGFSPKRTMELAQELYVAGLISYMRTDSVNVSADARKAAAEFIGTNYGAKFLPEKPNFYKSKSNAQEAHEAIRPTDVKKAPGKIDLEGPKAKLYDLIWRRFVASQMAEAKLSLKTVTIVAERNGIVHEYLFTASATSVEFEGFLKVMKLSLKNAKEGEDEDSSDEVDALPALGVDERLSADRWISNKKETKPPAHYSEAALVKALEENGVGRPSTYAATVETLVTRQYAIREKRQLLPTQRGMDVNDWLVSKLSELFAVEYTAQMEAELDEIEEGKMSGDGMLSNFYRKFQLWMDAAKEPPPPVEKVREMLDFLSEVKTWRPAPQPVAGRRVIGDHEFVVSVQEQLEKNERPVSSKQLVALVKLAVSYRDQVVDGDARLAALGYAGELDVARNAPSQEMVRWCFQTIDRIGGLQKNRFLSSLREQVDRGRTLSAKQFMILARSIGENSGALEDGDAVRAKLAPYAPDGFEVAPVDPAAPKLLKLLESVKEWKKAVKNGRRTYDDESFVQSLVDQYARRKSLSPRQVLALRRVCVNYKDQIPGYDQVAQELGLADLRPPAAAADRPKRRPARKRG